jgi:L-lactate dehydrogenase complex protein LldG
MSDPFLTHIANTLGRAAPATRVPTPPAIDESIARLVRSDGVDLVAKFVEMARSVKMSCDLVASTDELAQKLVAYLREKQLTRVVLTRCEAFESTGLLSTLASNGIDARWWDELKLDASYDVDAGITDVFAAVAETGSIVVRRSPSHGLAASLVPMTHVAVVRREQIVADLIDLMRKLGETGTGTGTVIITGPSKTADIEMNLVTGVHGPGVVQIWVL